MGLMGDKMHTVMSNFQAHTHQRKIYGKEVQNDHTQEPYDSEAVFAMHSFQKPASNPLIIHSPSNERLDPVVSKWELPMPINTVQPVHHNSHFCQGGTAMDKASPCLYRDSKAGTLIISQAATDEGSRTGIKGSGIVDIVSSNAMAVERNLTGTFPSSNKRLTGYELETSNMPSHPGAIIASRQMTIFYNGQAHVFDDVHPNKADAIMALAGSNSTWWSTTYGKSANQPPQGDLDAQAPFTWNETGHGDYFAYPRNVVGHAAQMHAPLQPCLPSPSTSGAPRSGGRNARLLFPTETNREGAKRKL